jgi:hypothetical protein
VSYRSGATVSGPALPLFDGRTYSPAKDGKRLATQLHRVRALMADGQWRTLGDIQEYLGEGSQTGISARLRDLRKGHNGGCQVERRRAAGSAGTWEYRVLADPQKQQIGGRGHGGTATQ